MPVGESAPEFFHTLHNSDESDIGDESDKYGRTDPGLLNLGRGVSVLPHKKYLLK